MDKEGDEESTSTLVSKKKKASGKRCRFYFGSTGCKWGDECRFRHEERKPKGESSGKSQHKKVSWSQAVLGEIKAVGRKYSDTYQFVDQDNETLEFLITISGSVCQFMLFVTLTPKYPEEICEFSCINPDIDMEVKSYISDILDTEMTKRKGNLMLLPLFQWIESHLEEMLHARLEEVTKRLKDAKLQFLSPGSIVVTPTIETSDHESEASEESSSHSNEDEDVTVPDDVPWKHMVNMEPPVVGDTTLILRQLHMKNIAFIRIDILALEIGCVSCNHKMQIFLDSTIHKPKITLCEKCQHAITVTRKHACAYKGQFIAALASIDGAQVLHCNDMLSTYATCMACLSETTVPSPKATAFKTDFVCHTCHEHMHVGWEVLIPRLVPANARPPQKKTSKKQRGPKVKAQGKFVKGQPLPDSGTCKHYKNSHRWIRFPCCGRAFPCDVCHDEQTGHMSEWGKTMICGFCSREISCATNPCPCGKYLFKAKSSQYWEGGKGCRDVKRLSRKDSHKYTNSKTKTVSRAAKKRAGKT